MDIEEEEMQFMGVLGIYKESYNIIFSWRKIFTQITLTSILPLSYYYWISGLTFELVGNTVFIYDLALGQTRLSYYWAALKAACFAIFLATSLLSTAAVVYTVASIYTARTITFNKVRHAVGLVYKRLIVTFLWILSAVFLYHALAALALILWATTSAGTPAFVALGVAYAVGLAYLAMIWQLASVVTVLEDARGVGAMRRSVELMRGRRVVSVVVFFTLYAASGAIQVAFEKLDGGQFGVRYEYGVVWLLVQFGVRFAYGVVGFLLVSLLMLFQLVVQTVIYFVCKSYHHENIDKSALADRLEVYLEEYAALKSKDDQLESETFSLNEDLVCKTAQLKTQA